MSEQLKLYPHICNAEDDKGVRCQVDMTEEEVKRDGMCIRCAEGIHSSVQLEQGPFIIKDPKTREF